MGRPVKSSGLGRSYVFDDPLTTLNLLKIRGETNWTSPVPVRVSGPPSLSLHPSRTRVVGLYIQEPSRSPWLRRKCGSPTFYNTFHFHATTPRPFPTLHPTSYTSSVSLLLCLDDGSNPRSFASWQLPLSLKSETIMWSVGKPFKVSLTTTKYLQW